MKNEEVAPEMEVEIPETEDPATDKPSGYSPGSGFEVGLRGGLFQILGEIKRGSPDSVGGFSNYGFAGSLRFALDNIFPCVQNSFTEKQRVIPMV